MKGLNKFFALRNFILAFTIFFSSVAAFAGDLDVAAAKGISEQTISAITGNLSKKLQTDLADNSVKVKINDIEKQQLSKTVHDFKGTAVAVVENDNNQLPIRFEVKLNPRTQSVSEVNYTFVEENSDFAPTSTEEILMQEIMKKVSVDYKTDSVVIAIDGFETIQFGDQKMFKGNGEIKIGEVEWSKISFDVVLGSDNKPAKIKYDIK
jgi:hypothetical protein